MRAYISLILYILTGTVWTLLTRRAQLKRKEPYDAAVLAVTVELCKLIASLTYYYSGTEKSLRFHQKTEKLKHLARTIGWYFVLPELCYCVYNALSFICLSLVEPPTYRLLINSKVLWSGLLLQCFFKQKLSCKQWFALVLLMVGVGLEQIGSVHLSNQGFLPLLLIMLQAFSSSLGGVIFQWLLQRLSTVPMPTLPVPGVASSQNDNSTISISSDDVLWPKNIFLYSWGLVLYSIYLFIYLFFVNDETPGITTLSSNPIVNLIALFRYNLDSDAVPIILITAAMGLVTSLVLRQYSVVAKEYANFADLCLVTLGSYLFLNTTLKPVLFLSVIIVSVSLYLYNTHPITNTTTATTTGTVSSSSTTPTTSSISSSSSSLPLSSSFKNIVSNVSSLKKEGGGITTTTYVIPNLSPDEPDTEIELETLDRGQSPSQDDDQHLHKRETFDLEQGPSENRRTAGVV